MKKDLLNTKKKITILIADDHKLLRETCVRLLETGKRFRVIGQASNGKDAIQLAEQLHPDIILMDISMEPVNGFDAAEAILRRNHDSKIIAVSMNMIPAIVKKILNLGVRGYVSKNSSAEEFTRAIVEVNSGAIYLCNEIKDLFAVSFMGKNASGTELLSVREIEVIQLLKQGLPSREIGVRLEISTKTVEVHRYNILKKLKLRNSSVLVNFSNENGL